jgi:hypothetical protein
VEIPWFFTPGFTTVFTRAHHVRHAIWQGSTFFQTCRSHLKILDARRVTRSMFQTKGPQTAGSTAGNLIASSTWRMGSVHPCCIRHHAAFSWWALRPCQTPKPKGPSLSAIKDQLLNVFADTLHICRKSHFSTVASNNYSHSEQYEFLSDCVVQFFVSLRRLYSIQPRVLRMSRLQTAQSCV